MVFQTVPWWLPLRRHILLRSGHACNHPPARASGPAGSYEALRGTVYRCGNRSEEGVYLCAVPCAGTCRAHMAAHVLHPHRVRDHRDPLPLGPHVVNNGLRPMFVRCSLATVLVGLFSACNDDGHGCVIAHDEYCGDPARFVYTTANSKFVLFHKAIITVSCE
jgi:hypothetical protein